MNNSITISANIKAPMEKVWEYWNKPEHITRWAFASDDWEAPFAENDLKEGGRFKTRMSAKDKSQGFDFEGRYTKIREHQLIEYEMSDGRKVKVTFEQKPEGVNVTETFEAEKENSMEMQRSGWQAILNNFKIYIEAPEPRTSI